MMGCRSTEIDTGKVGRKSQDLMIPRATLGKSNHSLYPRLEPVRGSDNGIVKAYTERSNLLEKTLVRNVHDFRGCHPGGYALPPR